MGKALHWIRVDVSTPDHPKVRRLERALGDAALAYLLRLWTWAAKFASDGDLSGFEWEEIEAAARWPGAPGRLVDELTRCGFLDDDDSGASLHGWQERQSDAASRRAAGAERQRRFRRRQVDGSDAVTQASAACHVETVTPVTQTEEPRNAVTVTPVTPSPVTPTYERTNGRTNSRESRRAGARDAEPPDPDLTPYLEALRGGHPRFGLEFDVARALHRHMATLPPLAEFVSALEAHAASDEWREGYAPSAARWVDGGGWKSPPPAGRRRAAELGPQPTVAPPQELDVVGRLRELQGQVMAMPASPAAVALVDSLARLIDRQLAHEPDPPEIVEDLLQGHESALLDRLAATLTKTERDQLLRDVNQALDRLARRVGEAGAAAVGERLKREAVRRRFGVPVLSLFAPAAGVEEAA